MGRTKNSQVQSGHGGRCCGKNLGNRAFECFRTKRTRTGNKCKHLFPLLASLLSARFPSFLPLEMLGNHEPRENETLENAWGHQPLPHYCLHRDNQRQRARVWMVRSLAALLSYSQPLTQLFPLKFEMYFHVKLFKNVRGVWGEEGMVQVERGREKRTENDCTLK